MEQASDITQKEVNLTDMEQNINLEQKTESEQDLNNQVVQQFQQNIQDIQEPSDSQKELIMQTQVEDNQKQQMGILSNLPKDINEVYSHYQLRKIVFENAYVDLQDEKKAITYSYLWSNSFFLGVKYSENLMEIIKKYEPSKQLLEQS